MFWKKINLAPILYAKVHRDYGGPISSISCRESERLGVTVFEAFATLDLNATGFFAEQGSLYGDSHGSGTATAKPEAVYRAISEALERWAWFGSLNDQKLIQLTGIDLDPSTTGFAAFPGLTTEAARNNSFLEAVERWSLNTWWESKLPHRPFNPVEGNAAFSGIEIITPIPRASVAVIWKNTEYGRAYGFAAGKDLAYAVSKAKVELGRNIHVLEFAKKTKIPPSTRNERRLLYFSNCEGKEKFEQRLAAQCTVSLEAPKLIVNCQVPGPWAKYTRVWRCLFEARDHSDPNTDDYFHF